jgi:hypothetical protein
MIKCVKGEVELEGTSQELVAECMTILRAMNDVVQKDPTFEVLAKDITMLKVAVIMDAIANIPKHKIKDKLNGNS